MWRLVTTPGIKFCDGWREIELQADARSRKEAEMLLQKDDTVAWRLVYCVGRRKNEAERRYCSSRLELVTIVWAAGRLRCFLLGMKFVTVTDCILQQSS